MPALRTGFGQIDDQLEVSARLGRRIIRGALGLRNLGDVNGRQEHATKLLQIGQFDDRVRVGHVHPDTAQHAIDARDPHLDHLARG